MVDVGALKGRLDCRDVVARDLGEPVSRGSAWMWKCPLHYESKGASLAVWENGWRCFGKCQKGGDVVSWVEAYRGVAFREAVEVLGGGTISPAPVRRVSAVSVAEGDDMPAVDWRGAAAGVVVAAERWLWGEGGERALGWLRDVRKLDDDIIKMAKVGYVPGAPGTYRTIEGLSVPCGILLPNIIDGEVWALKGRVAAGLPKYRQVKGGSGKGLYGVDAVVRGDVVVIVEGEFDSLVLRQTGLVSSVALGSAANPLRARWLDRLLFAPRIWAVLDDDDAGEQARQRLAGMSGRIVPGRLPEGHHDVNDFWVADEDGFYRWVCELLT